MKKILLISDMPTHPVRGGNQQSILAYVKLLGELGYDVFYFLAYDHFYYPFSHFKETQEQWKDRFFFYKQPFALAIFQKIIKKLHRTYEAMLNRYEYKIDVHYPWGMNRMLKHVKNQQKFDAIFINYIWISKAYKIFPETHKVLFTHDVFSCLFRRTGNRFFFSTSTKEESKALNRCDTIISVQENESVFFRSLTSKKVYTTYSPIEGCITSFCGNKSISYIGANIPFNVESIHDFVKNVFPLILMEFPDVVLYIAGTVCESFDQSLYHSNIVLLGRMNELDSFYEISDIIINPTEKGSGLKIKSIEALMYNKVLISHPHSVEGFFDQDNVPIKLASNPHEYVNIISTLFNDPQKIIESKNEVKNYVKKYNTFVKDQMQKAFDCR